MPAFEPVLTPQQALQLMQQAVAHMNRGEWDLAEAPLLRARGVVSVRPDALQLLAGVRAGQGRHDEAEDLYRQSLKLNPRQAHVHLGLGNLFVARGAPGRAIPAYREAVRLKRDYFEAYLNLAIAQAKEDDKEGAEISYRAALRLKPDSIPARQGLGAVLNDTDRAALGEVLLREALTLAAREPWREAAVTHNLAISLKA